MSLRDALHETVDEFCDGNNIDKWINVIGDAEALIAALDESYEREIALQKLMECAWWYSVAASKISTIDKQTAKKVVRRMHKLPNHGMKE